MRSSGSPGVPVWQLTPAGAVRLPCRSGRQAAGGQRASHSRRWKARCCDRQGVLDAPSRCDTRRGEVVWSGGESLAWNGIIEDQTMLVYLLLLAGSGLNQAEVGDSGDADRIQSEVVGHVRVWGLRHAARLIHHVEGFVGDQAERRSQRPGGERKRVEQVGLEHPNVGAELGGNDWPVVQVN